MDEFSKVAVYKINTHKSVVLLYTSNEQLKKIKKINPLIIASKSINSLGINLIKEEKDFYAENYKTLLKFKKI